MRKLCSFLLGTALLASAAVCPALADGWRDHGDIHHFHDHDYDHWRRGRWFNGFHDGRNGWWWIVGGGWYFYPAPVYPYPDPYTPPTVVVQTAPAHPANGAAAYYYCPNPAGYYPYVPQCYRPWRKVIAASIAPPPQAVAPAGEQREADERRLESLTAAFKNIDLTGRQAPMRLKNLDEQVEAFRQSLYNRHYNAMALLKDAEKLQHRITGKRERLSGHGQRRDLPPPSVPPDTAVTFPPGN